MARKALNKISGEIGYYEKYTNNGWRNIETQMLIGKDNLTFLDRAPQFSKRVETIKDELIATIKKTIKELGTDSGIEGTCEDFEECTLYPSDYDNSAPFEVKEITEDGVTLRGIEASEDEIREPWDNFNVYDLIFFLEEMEYYIEEYKGL